MRCDCPGIPFDTPDPIASTDARALSPEGENTFTKDYVRVLVFDSGGRFVYEPEVKEVKAHPEDDKTTGVIVLKALTPGSGQTFVVLVNASGPTSLPSHQQLYELPQLFSYSLPENGAWDEGKLPMWGQLSGVSIADGEGWPRDKTVHLTRAVARVDVGLRVTKTPETRFKETAEGIPGITLRETHFYNAASIGCPVPRLDRAGDPLPTTRSDFGLSAPIMKPMDRSADIDDAGTLLLRGAYLPEAQNPNDPSYAYKNRPFIVVGLAGADDTRPDVVTYYRIDYLTRGADGSYRYLPLLRNHRYLVNITAVGGRGFDTPDDAADAPASSLTYDVLPWEESAMSDVVYDGQYYLSVSEDHLQGYRGAGSQATTTIRTSWPGGFKVRGLPSWIRSSHWDPDLADDPTGAKEVTFTFTVENTGTTDRTWPERNSAGEIVSDRAYIEAGRMRWYLDFTQSTEEGSTGPADDTYTDLRVDPQVLDYGAVDPTIRGVKVTALKKDGQWVTLREGEYSLTK